MERRVDASVRETGVEKTHTTLLDSTVQQRSSPTSLRPLSRRSDAERDLPNQRGPRVSRNAE
jgi:hypothetical protein